MEDSVKQEMTFTASGYCCQPFKHCLIFSFCLESHFGLLVSNPIVNWDIAKNISPLFEWKVLQDGGELQHRRLVAFKHTASTQGLILYSSQVTDCSLFFFYETWYWLFNSFNSSGTKTNTALNILLSVDLFRTLIVSYILVQFKGNCKNKNLLICKTNVITDAPHAFYSELSPSSGKIKVVPLLFPEKSNRGSLQAALC